MQHINIELKKALALRLKPKHFEARDEIIFDLNKKCDGCQKKGSLSDRKQWLCPWCLYFDFAYYHLLNDELNDEKIEKLIRLTKKQAVKIKRLKRYLQFIQNELDT